MSLGPFPRSGKPDYNPYTGRPTFDPKEYPAEEQASRLSVHDLSERCMREFDRDDVLGIDITTDMEGDLVRLFPDFSASRILQIAEDVFQTVTNFFFDVKLVTLIIHETDGGKRTSFYVDRGLGLGREEDGGGEYFHPHYFDSLHNLTRACVKAFRNNSRSTIRLSTDDRPNNIAYLSNNYEGWERDIEGLVSHFLSKSIIPKKTNYVIFKLYDSNGRDEIETRFYVPFSRGLETRSHGYHTREESVGPT